MRCSDAQREGGKRVLEGTRRASARSERQRCLIELGKDLDIPAEVLMHLPSAGEIQERGRAGEGEAGRAPGAVPDREGHEAGAEREGVGYLP